MEQYSLTQIIEAVDSINQSIVAYAYDDCDGEDIEYMPQVKLTVTGNSYSINFLGFLVYTSGNDVEITNEYDTDPDYRLDFLAAYWRECRQDIINLLEPVILDIGCAEALLDDVKDDE